MANKAENKTVMSCKNEECRVLLYIPSENDDNINCPSCDVQGFIAVSGETRNLGQRYYPSITNADIE